MFNKTNCKPLIELIMRIYLSGYGLEEENGWWWQMLRRQAKSSSSQSRNRNNTALRPYLNSKNVSKKM
jgi:hypothetical protein